MAPIARGFHGRRPTADPSRIPPGQHLERGFPVLSAGPTPQVDLADWTFTIDGAVDKVVTFTSQEVMDLPSETPMVDIHCVTKW